MAAPTALATARWGTWTTSEIPSMRGGTRNAPPPTATRGAAPASVFIRSTASSIIAEIVTTQARTSPGASEATRRRSPRSTSPAATATSVAVRSDPPNTRLRWVSS